MIVYPKDKGQKEFYEALGQLVNNEDFKRFTIWLMDSLQENRAKNDMLQNVPGKPLLDWNQGECQNLTKILGVIASGKETLEKLRKQADANK